MVVPLATRRSYRLGRSLQRPGRTRSVGVGGAIYHSTSSARVSRIETLRIGKSKRTRSNKMRSARKRTRSNKMNWWRMRSYGRPTSGIHHRLPIQSMRKRTRSNTVGRARSNGSAMRFREPQHQRRRRRQSRSPRESTLPGPPSLQRVTGRRRRRGSALPPPPRRRGRGKPGVVEWGGVGVGGRFFIADLAMLRNQSN